MRKILTSIFIVFLVCLMFVSARAVCTPDCTGKQCGSDGCGGSCGSCSTDYTCESSKCVTCTDTDESNDFFTKGILEIKDSLGNIIESQSDECAGSSANLKQYSCLYDTNKNEWEIKFDNPTYPCQFGCHDGACKQNNIPEFSSVAAGISLAGAAAGFIFLRRRK